MVVDSTDLKVRKAGLPVIRQRQQEVLIMISTERQRLSVPEFEASAAATDRLEDADLDFAVLGLVGEVGSLVSALKKKRRDTDGFFGYHASVVEEFGDVLWYVSAVARRGGTSLAEVIARATSRASDGTFSCLEPEVVGTDNVFKALLLTLASEAGDLAKRFAIGAYNQNVDALRGDLIKFIRPLGEAAASAEVSLDEAAAENIVKREDRWPTERRYPDATDGALHIDEQLPRTIARSRLRAPSRWD